MKSIIALSFGLALLALCGAQDLPTKSTTKSGVLPPVPTGCHNILPVMRTFLAHSKNELMKHIAASHKHICAKQGWKRVDRSMIEDHHHAGCKHMMKDEKDGGLRVDVQVTEKSCGVDPTKVSEFALHIKGNWKQIMFTQTFEGSSKCWAIFGNHNSKYHALPHDVSGGGLEVFSKSHGDVIVSEENMNSLTEDKFDGRSSRCDDASDNFWHSGNGNGKRHATVIMRRKPGAVEAGLYTGIYCGTPKYSFTDIYVLM